MANILRMIMTSVMIVCLVDAHTISEQCRVQDGAHVKCECNGEEEFLLPEGYNYENVTSFQLSSCTSANLHFSSLTEAYKIEVIIVRNISRLLSFELFLTSKSIKKLELSRIHKIPVITHDTFASIKHIESFKIQDALIENFEEQFTDIVVADFVMRNVTLERVDGVNFSERGTSLSVTNTIFRNVTNSLNFAYFDNVEIRDSEFELRKPNHIRIEGNAIVVVNSVFSNATMNLVAKNGVTINSSCADGKSSLRVSSGRIQSYDNKLPTEIVYTRSKGDRASPEYTLSVQNNTVCLAGNCKCPKSNAQNSCLQSTWSFVFYLVLLVFPIFWSGN